MTWLWAMLDALLVALTLGWLALSALIGDARRSRDRSLAGTGAITKRRK